MLQARKLLRIYKHEQFSKITKKINKTEKYLLLQSLVMLRGADNPWFYCGRPPALNWLHVVAARIDIKCNSVPDQWAGFQMTDFDIVQEGEKNQCGNISPTIKNRFHKL